MGGRMYNPEITPEEGKLDVKDTSQENVDKIWYEAEDKARDYASKKGIYLSVAASGYISKELTLDEKRHINMIEAQKITLSYNVPGDGSKDYLIKPEKNHLMEMKSVNEIFQEFKDSIDSFVEENNNSSFENYQANSNDAANRLNGLLDGNEKPENVISILDNTGRGEIELKGKENHLYYKGKQVKMNNGKKIFLDKNTKSITIDNSWDGVKLNIFNKDGSKEEYAISGLKTNVDGYPTLKKFNPYEK